MPFTLVGMLLRDFIFGEASEREKHDSPAVENRIARRRIRPNDIPRRKDSELPVRNFNREQQKRDFSRTPFSVLSMTPEMTRSTHERRTSRESSKPRAPESTLPVS